MIIPHLHDLLLGMVTRSQNNDPYRCIKPSRGNCAQASREKLFFSVITTGYKSRLQDLNLRAENTEVFNPNDLADFSRLASAGEGQCSAGVPSHVSGKKGCLFEPKSRYQTRSNPPEPALPDLGPGNPIAACDPQLIHQSGESPEYDCRVAPAFSDQCPSSVEPLLGTFSLSQSDVAMRSLRPAMTVIGFLQLPGRYPTTPRITGVTRFALAPGLGRHPPGHARCFPLPRALANEHRRLPKTTFAMSSS